jgi:hypothetical protein
MDWNRIEGNWKQVKGEVKGAMGVSSPATTWMSLTVSRIGSKAVCSSASVTPRTRPRKRLTTGTTDKPWWGGTKAAKPR